MNLDASGRIELHSKTDICCCISGKNHQESPICDLIRGPSHSVYRTDHSCAFCYLSTSLLLCFFVRCLFSLSFFPALSLNKFSLVIGHWPLYCSTLIIRSFLTLHSQSRNISRGDGNDRQFVHCHVLKCMYTKNNGTLVHSPSSLSLSIWRPSFHGCHLLRPVLTQP